MSGSLAAIITIPIVVFLALAGWVSVVMYAGFHPSHKRKSAPPQTDAAGGVFLATDGGRQLMPIWDGAPAEIPAQRTAAAEETYQASGAARASEQTSSGEAAQPAGERLPAGIGLPPS